MTTPPTETPYFKLGEVCEFVGVQAHVLRYWETEFPMLAPSKDRSGKRIYSEGDVQVAKRIKELLYEEQFTIAGARKRLELELSNARLSQQELTATLLIADGDEELRILLAEYFRRLMFEVITASTPDGAIQVVRDRRPDLAIVDLSQSTEDQRRVIEKLSQQGIPVLVLSARDLLDDKADVFKAGASDFVAKPFSPRELEYRVQAILRRNTVNDLQKPTLLQNPPPVGKKTARDPYRIIGEVIKNRYELVEYAGGGGMGAVYRALDRGTRKKVAVKILKPDIAERDSEYNELFEKEVKAAENLFHPHIVQVFDSGNHDDLSFMVMEWVEGKCLEEVISNERLSIERIKLIFGEICDAISYAHDKRIIHLDIKPANIFLVDQTDGTDFVKVFDFGLARIITKESGTTVTRFRGTHQYCAPEQFGGRVSFRSDIYSLAATLYHLIAGVVPFSTTYIHAKIHPNLELPIIPSVTTYRNLPVRIDNVMSRALSKDPFSRQESAKQLFEEFSNAIDLND